MIIKLTQIELYKIFKKWRAYVGFIGLTVLISIMQYSMHVRGKRYISHMLKSFPLPFIQPENLLNAYLVAFFILKMLVMQLPFLITIVSGELMAGEAVGGTLRMILTRPVSRFSLLTAKYLAGVIYTCLLLLWFIILSLGIGIFVFGTGDLLIMNKSPLILFQNDVPWRFVCAYLFAALSMISVSSLAFLFSCLVENAIGPIISTITVIIVFVMISSIDFDIFNDIQPYLFTNYILNWELFFQNPLDMARIYQSIGILAGHIILFYLTALYIFKKKDILS